MWFGDSCALDKAFDCNRFANILVVVGYAVDEGREINESVTRTRFDYVSSQTLMA